MCWLEFATSFQGNTKNTDRNGVNEQNAYIKTQKYKIGN